MSEIINILVASRHEDDRNQILAILEGRNDMQIISVEKDEFGVIARSKRLKPEIIILDLNPLENIEELELISIIHRNAPFSSIILLCNNNEIDYAANAITAGVTGFLIKNIDINKLIHIIKIINLGDTFVSASITIRAVNSVHSNKFLNNNFNEELIKKEIPAFTTIERHVLTNIAKGLSDNEIARHLNYNTGTIRNIILAIKRKTKLKNRIQIIIYLLIYRIINLDIKEFLSFEKLTTECE